MKTLNYLSMLILGIFIGIFYFVVTIVILMISNSNIMGHEQLLLDIYKYYLPALILFVAIIFKQTHAFICILVSLITEIYCFYLWDEMWRQATWIF
ncbi:hypothetical protein BC351_22550 [Paenibacillus ferrarius]|uniref:Uncharacterized protein n=1 Tax=Paenibacillus ferrarius TaxID=1469647 RepID=A0A1V4HLZ2_9BACL|nr:hypothetical protein BC351_22550 [Paenibacillus ferrarius]